MRNSWDIFCGFSRIYETGQYKNKQAELNSHDENSNVFQLIIFKLLEIRFQREYNFFYTVYHQLKINEIC